MQRGRWLLRLEDLDRPRVVAGSADAILHTLERFGFEWDEPVLRQSERLEAYGEALERMRSSGLTFECGCSRSQLADEERYPGNCRDRRLEALGSTATRVRVPSGTVGLDDRIQGSFRQNLAAASGDFVIRRRDGLFAYVLAVVVDDAHQGITDVVRGADLLDNTARQIYLQRILGLHTPRYAHVPVLSEPDGRKLAKSARSVPLDSQRVVPQLVEVYRLLGLAAPHDLASSSVAEAWNWATRHWRIDAVPKRLSLRLSR